MNAKEIEHILSQIGKLAIILGCISVLLILLGVLTASAGLSGVIFLFMGLVYLILAIVLFTKRSKDIMLAGGLVCTLVGLFTGIVPLLVGIALLYYYNEYTKLLKKSEPL